MIVSAGPLSYGFAAVGFLVLALLLGVSWEGRAQGIRLIVACAVTSAWAALVAWYAASGEVPTVAPVLAEILRYGAWFNVIVGLMRTAGIGTTLGRVMHAAWIGCAVALLAGPAALGAGLVWPGPPALLRWAGLGLSLLGLMALEQIYRNAREAGRFALKFFVVSVGGIFAYDLFLYSQAQLLQGVDPVSWDARGFVALLMVPLLAVAARRNPQWSLNVFVSRQVAFYTASFALVGAYLLLMALGGYLIRLYGGTWGTAAQLVFLAGAIVVLVLLVISGTVRRRLRVFLSKHFYRNKYDYRLEWLRFIRTLSVPEEGIDTRENAVRAIAQIISSPGGVLFLRGDEPDLFEVAAAWPAGDFTEARRFPPLPEDDELVQFLREFEWVVDLRELRLAPDVYRHLTLPAFLLGSERIRLVVPLVHGETMIGFVLLASPPDPFNPNYEDRDLLKTVGRHVAVHLAQLDADRRLAESRQFEGYHRLTAFVMHDLKNLAAQLALIVSNAEKHRRNPEFVDDAISTIANSTARMQRLIEQLQRREVQSPRRHVRLDLVAKQAVERCQVSRPRPTLGETLEAWVEADPERLVMTVEHAIRNAQDATPPDGNVTVTVGMQGPQSLGEAGDTGRMRVPAAVLTVADTGSGMTRAFVQERLFKPFDTTKGSKGMGIGAYQVREYVQSLGGRVEVASEPGRGTRLSLRIPLVAPPSAPDDEPVAATGEERL